MKMCPVCVFVCAVITLTHAAVDRSSDCPGGWTLLNGRCFLYVPGPMTWAKAERNCLSMRANLASVHSITEYHGIQHLMVTASHVNQETWIGGTDAQEPNNFRRNQHCLQINHSGSKCWDDIACSKSRPSVCVKKM
uniref:C-type lectin domain-containing protein n=1 Tax=Astatotilapia calliptera TaxID=8154 RepID=A0A3P8Q4Z2_ASTCA